MKLQNPKLGVNIDHVATLRQARGTDYPSIVNAALAAESGGADFITVHLREDRRHIQDSDVFNLKREIKTYLNLELAATEAMKQIALELVPSAICIVPEKREEITTEGGLDITKKHSYLAKFCEELSAKGITVALFLEPDLEHIELAASIGVAAIELHTGEYANTSDARRKKELDRLTQAASLGRELGLIINAGHGLNYENVWEVSRIGLFTDLNIGHSIVCKAIDVGLASAVKLMKDKLKGNEF